MLETIRCYLLILLSVVPLCLSPISSWAENEPTREHQQFHQMDYTPLVSDLLKSSGQPLIEVTINEKQNATFLIDTGSTGSIISTELAKQMKLSLRPAVGSENVPETWNGKQALMTNISVLRAGSILFNNVPLFVLDAKQFVLSPRNSTRSYQGIIGINVLQQVAILLDSQKHKLVFCIPGDLYQKQVALLEITQPSVLTLTHINGLQWSIPAQFTNNGLKANEDLVVDTGADHTYVSQQLAKQVNLKVHNIQGAKTIYGIGVVAETTTDELSLGDLTLRDFPLTIQPVSGQEPPVLGMDILSGYRVLMDFPAKKMYLQPNTAAVPAVTIGPAPATTAPPAK